MNNATINALNSYVFKKDNRESNQMLLKVSNCAGHDCVLLKDAGDISTWSLCCLKIRELICCCFGNNDYSETVNAFSMDSIISTINAIPEDELKEGLNEQGKLALQRIKSISEKYGKTKLKEAFFKKSETPEGERTPDNKGAQVDSIQTDKVVTDLAANNGLQNDQPLTLEEPRIKAEQERRVKAARDSFNWQNNKRKVEDNKRLIFFISEEQVVQKRGPQDYQPNASMESRWYPQELVSQACGFTTDLDEILDFIASHFPYAVFADMFANCHDSIRAYKEPIFEMPDPLVEGGTVEANTEIYFQYCKIAGYFLDQLDQGKWDQNTFNEQVTKFKKYCNLKEKEHRETPTFAAQEIGRYAHLSREYMDKWDNGTFDNNPLNVVVMGAAIYAKAQKDPVFREVLMMTDGYPIAEIKFCPVWGSLCHKDNAPSVYAVGKNYLGNCLMKVRQVLISEGTILPPNKETFMSYLRGNGHPLVADNA